HRGTIFSHAGVVHLDGHIRGYVNGYIDAEIHGKVNGEINAHMEIDNLKDGQTSAEPAPQATEAEPAAEAPAYEPPTQESVRKHLEEQQKRA
ncbi:MAG: hypothetical protein IKI81_06120, partial [Selenomonadaceae bacterium]|nr:hypothetical protein [Selenomonadaceae bacterium]